MTKNQSFSIGVTTNRPINRREIRHIYVSRRIMFAYLLFAVLMKTTSSVEALQTYKCGQKHGLKKVASLLVSLLGISQIFPIPFEVWIPEQDVLPC